MMSFPQELRPDTGEALMWLRITREAFPSPDQVVAAIRSNPSLSKALVDASGKLIAQESQPWWTENFIIAPFLYKYFTVVESSAFDDPAFEQIFGQLAEAFESPVTTVVELSTLANVQLATTEIPISPGMKLRQISKDETERWLNRDPLLSFNPISTLELVELQCAIETTYQQPRTQAIRSPQKLAEKSERLLTAIRLLFDSNVGIVFTERMAQGFLVTGAGGTTWPPSARRGGRSVELDADDCSSLLVIWNRIQSSLNSERASLALRRWDTSVERVRLDDQLVDYWIALESLFAPDSSQEVRYIASLRMAAFLGQTSDERAAIYDDMRKSYDTRSDIVHGNVAGFNENRRLRFEADLPVVAGKTRAYLRKALLNILESGEQFKPEELETQLLRKQ
jgi:hypothetical protein